MSMYKTYFTSFFCAFFNIKDIDFLPGLKGESQQKVLLSNDNTIFYFTSSAEHIT